MYLEKLDFVYTWWQFSWTTVCYLWYFIVSDWLNICYAAAERGKYEW